MDVAVRGARRPLSPAVEAAAFRIVQESLTNVVHHAGAATVRVALSYEPRAVELEVVDDGGGGPGDGGGHGLQGMRERAEAVGGEVVAGPRAGGGFGVWARLPDEAVRREGG